MKSWIAALAFSLGLGSDIHAARPFITDDAGTVAHQDIEIEAGADWNGDLLDGGIGIKHGLSSRMDLGFGFGYLRSMGGDHHFTDAELGMKFGLVPDLLAVTAAGCFGNNTVSLNLVGSRVFPALTMDAVLGMGALANGNRADLAWSVCLHRELGRFTAGAEISGSHEAVERWQAGGCLSLSDRVAVDAALSGMPQNDGEWLGTLGITFTLPANKEK